MNDYKHNCNWRGSMAALHRKQSVRAVLLAVLMLGVYGFVGYLEQEPVAVEPVVREQQQIFLAQVHVLERR